MWAGTLELVPQAAFVLLQSILSRSQRAHCPGQKTQGITASQPWTVTCEGPLTWPGYTPSVHQRPLSRSLSPAQDLPSSSLWAWLVGSGLASRHPQGSPLALEVGCSDHRPECGDHLQAILTHSAGSHPDFLALPTVCSLDLAPVSRDVEIGGLRTSP